MGEFHCDRCQGPLLVHDDVRYKVNIRVQAVYDIAEITHQDIQQATDGSIQEILESIEDKSAEELEAEIFKIFEFDLCRRCQQRYLRNPLGKPDLESSP